ncbi:small ribosomal subunit protein mS29 [Lampetra planeri]
MQRVPTTAKMAAPRAYTATLSRLPAGMALFKSLHVRLRADQLSPLSRLLHAGARACCASAAPEAEFTAAVTPQDPRDITANEPRAIFRTAQADPALHSESHAGRFYTISPSDLATVFPHGLPRRFYQQMRTFQEASLMVRPPALELIALLKGSDLSLPVVRYVIYGKKGTGKSMTLCHAVHYCASQGWMVLHVPDAHQWLKDVRQLMPSAFRPGRVDTPMQAVSWLGHFRTTNERLLKQMTTRSSYSWSKRESTEQGRPLLEMIELGLLRPKVASDVVGALFKELKQQSAAMAQPLLVAVDSVNALWGRTSLRNEDRSIVNVEDVTLLRNLKKFVLNDWSNGAMVSTVTQTGSLYTNRLSYFPQELLGKDGFDLLDPFVPVQVNDYSELEFESCYQYYLERKWLQHEKSRTEEGRQELIFLSNRNPSLFERISTFL